MWQRKECTTATHNVDEYYKQNVEWKKPDTREHTVRLYKFKKQVRDVCLIVRTIRKTRKCIL